MTLVPNRRILLVDDNVAIHEDFKKIIGTDAQANVQLADAMSGFFGGVDAKHTKPAFELESAHQGQDALEMVKKSIADNRPYALAFVDVRMPPGWDGIQTIARLWEVDPKLQAVVCTAYADYSWDQMIAQLGHSDRLLILKKPFDPIEVQQIAAALTEKWNGTAREQVRFDEARAAAQEAKVYASSLMLTNRALETARSGAVAAAQAKSEFLTNMSHEIRTPMIAVLGHADLLSEVGLSEEERQEHVSTIREQGVHLLALLSDILDIAALETGRLTAETTPCSVRSVLDETRARFQDRASRKGIVLSTQCSDAVPQTIACDASRVRQVLQHLVGNAIKFTEHGSVTVRAGIESDLGGENARMQIAVEDTGVGVTTEERGRLFEAFSQADTSLTRKHGGAGLGLALSRRLALLLGGDLDVESEAGRGSRFTLSFPLRTTTMPEPLAPLPSDAKAQAAPGLKGRVLLVEDVLSTQRLYSLYLRRAGADVEVADNGQIAVERCTEALENGRPYDVVLMDMQMPVLDGYAATRTLRSQGYRAPIVAVTAHALSGDREKCLAAGCDDYVAKPTDREELVSLIREWTHRGVPAPLPSAPASEVRVQR